MASTAIDTGSHTSASCAAWDIRDTRCLISSGSLSIRVGSPAYDPDTESIYVRFSNGRSYRYDACPSDVWEAFTSPGQSPGKFLNEVLKFKPYQRHVD